MRHYFFIVIYACVLFGCAPGPPLPTGLYPPDRYVFNRMASDIRWIERTTQELEKYFGKTSEEIRQIFGNPVFVQKNIVAHRKKYDEILWYRYGRGIVLIDEMSWGYIFYFIDNALVHVRVI